MTTECSICFDTKKPQLMAKCTHCDFDICKECFYQTLISSNSIEVFCVNPECKKEYDREFIKRNVGSQKNARALLKHHGEILIQREKSLLPVSQKYAEQIKTAREHRRTSILKYAEYTSIINHTWAEVSEVINILKTVPSKDNKATINELREVYNEQKQDLYNQYKQVFCSQKTYLLGKYTTSNALAELLHDESNAGESVPKPTINHKCSMDCCRGFLDEKWVCRMCNTLACSKCHEIVGPASDTVKKSEHECDPGIVETVKLLKKDTKPCPSCGEMIHKIDGCDQMYCVTCYTPFSWITGKIETGRIHNPHYFQLQRERGVPIPRVDECENELIPTITLYYPETEKIAIEAINAQEMMRRRFAYNYNINETLVFRVQYLLGEKTEDQFFTDIEKYHKKLQKNKDVFQILDMYVHVIGDLLRLYINDNDIHKLRKDTKDIQDYANQYFCIIEKYYNNKTPRFHNGKIYVTALKSV